MANPRPGSQHVSRAQVLSQIDFTQTAPNRNEGLPQLYWGHKWVYPELTRDDSSDAEDLPPSNTNGLRLNDEPFNPKAAPPMSTGEPHEPTDTSLESKASPVEWVDVSLVPRGTTLEPTHSRVETREISINMEGAPGELNVRSLKPSKPLEQQNKQLDVKDQTPSQPSRIWSLPLTPFEQNAPRQYKRIAMLVRLDLDELDPDHILRYKQKL